MARVTFEVKVAHKDYRGYNRYAVELVSYECKATTFAEAFDFAVSKGADPAKNIRIHLD